MAEAAHRYPGARNPDFRRVLVTGALGKVGVRVVQAFHADKSGKPWEVVSTDVARGVFVRAAILPRSVCHRRCRWLVTRASLVAGHAGQRGPVELPAGRPDRRWRGVLQ